jgi:hypothetical protein
MFIFFMFKKTLIMRHFRSFCHNIDYVTLKLYDNFPVSQTGHIKEVTIFDMSFCSQVSDWS